MAKKISNSFENVMDTAFPNEEAVSWNGMEFTVKRVVSLTDTLSIVKSVVESCFNDDGVYMPELKNFAFKVNVINKYTNITLPDGAERQYALLFRTNLFSDILGKIDEAQISVVCDAIDEKIQYECDTQMRDLRTRLEKMIESLGVVADNAMALFGGIGQDDMENLVKAVSNGRLDEAAVVEAFLEQSKK